MRPICTVVDGLPSGGTVSSFPGPFSVYEMSLLRALGPVQTWLGQELEKCGIDAMIYTRYILSLLLQDSYDYDLQEQENDIFLGWEKGVCKKWGKGKKKNSDLSLEEMKKQAAVQCLLSASDESSGIETLVEELCSKLKDLQSNQDEQLSVSKEEKSNNYCGPLSPEAVSPAGKDEAEMYYAAFPPLSEKPVCLQEIMTVWNKSKVCSSSSSSSSTAPQTSTETPSPKDCNSESETIITNRNGAPNTVQGKNQQRKGKIEKENKFSNGANEDKIALCKSVRHKFNGKARPRSWSSGSSEGGSSSSGNPGEGKQRLVKIKHKIREVRNKKGKSGQRTQAKSGEKKNVANSRIGTVKPLCKRVRRQVKECKWKEFENEGDDISAERKHDIKFREEPLWYTEPITEYLVPLNNRSKLETTYRKRQDDFYNTSKEIEELSEFVHGLQLSNHNIHQTYLSAGTFIEGHFVEVPAVIHETSDHTGTSKCSLQEDSYLDDVHPLELSHFYEVDIDQSMLDPCASDKIQGESRILNMIRQKNERDLEAESCKVLNEKSLQGESAIWRESTSSIGAEGFFLQDHNKLAQFWDSCSPSSSADADGESLGGDSPDMFSPFLDSTKLSTNMHAGNQDIFFDGDNSYFSVFEVQCRNSVFSLPVERVLNEISKTESCSSTNGFGKTRSRLLIWTKNSAFDENEQCSNISTRTCSPWSHSEEARSDTETFNDPLEECRYMCAEDLDYVAPRVTLHFQDEDACAKSNLLLQCKVSGEESVLVPTKTSKLESLCGIQLEKEHPEMCEIADVSDPCSTHTEEYSSGVIKDIWVNTANGNSEKVDDPLFPVDLFLSGSYFCQDPNAAEETFQEPNKAVQRSEYHLWEGQSELLEKRAFLRRESSKIDVGDYTTPFKPWERSHVKENSFIPGGVYGELKTLNGEDEWSVVPQSQAKGSLLECSTTDVVTIAGTDVFMTPGNSCTPGQRPFWRPFVSFEESPPPNHGDGSLNKGFSFILHENLLGACNSFQVEEPSMGYSFSSFELNNRYSQVLHVECSFEPGGVSAGSPNFKPKFLRSDSDGDMTHPIVCGVEQTQYRSIRISPRTHFRPIPASELSPAGGSESDLDSEKDEVVVPALCEEVFDDPQDDLQPLEEDAVNEGHFYGKAELESGKFFPKWQKCGMEKSAQTSLDCQESCDMSEDKQDDLDFRIIERGVMDDSQTNCKTQEATIKTDGSTDCRKGSDPMEVLDEGLQRASLVKEKPSWWQKALYSPLIRTASLECEYMKLKKEGREDEINLKELSCAAWHTFDIEEAAARHGKPDIEYGAGMTGSIRKMCSSDSSSSNSSDDFHHWARLRRQELCSRTQL